MLKPLKELPMEPPKFLDEGEELGRAPKPGRHNQRHRKEAEALGVTSRKR